MRLPELGKSKLGRAYKYRPPPRDHHLLAARQPLSFSDGTTLPPVVDLRPMCTPVRDQGQEGSCSGFSTAAFKELNCAVWSGSSGPIGGYLSPAYLYGRTRMAEGTFPQDSGCSVADEFSVLSAWGVCPESFMPYNQDPAEAPTPPCDVAAKSYRCGVPSVVDTSDPVNLKTLLAKSKPAVIGFTVYQSFEDTGPDGVVRMPDPSTESVLGGHAVLVCGYDGTGWLIRNSWGSGWANGGYCVQPYGYEAFWMECWTTPPTPPGS
jgi:hypothetical protein